MAYEKQTWETGQVITAEKLNHMEDGIEGASNNVFMINVTTGDSVISTDVSFNDIKNAMESGKIITFAPFEVVIQGTALITGLAFCGIAFDGTSYSCFAIGGSPEATFIFGSSTPDGILQQVTGQ